LTAARVGILGGSFNPPHLGHLVCAQEALGQLGLDQVLLMPAGIPPHKELDDPGAEERLELCRRATAREPRLEVSRLEIDRPGPSYTVDTLRTLHERSREAELTFIAGGDMAQSLGSWHEPREVLRLARLAVAERAGAGRDDVLASLAPLAPPPGRVIFLDAPRIDISSSMIRRRVAEGRPIRHLVPDAVAQRIAGAGLYRSPLVAAVR